MSEWARLEPGADLLQRLLLPVVQAIAHAARHTPAATACAAHCRCPRAAAASPPSRPPCLHPCPVHARTLASWWISERCVQRHGSTAAPGAAVPAAASGAHSWERPAGSIPCVPHLQGHSHRRTSTMSSRVLPPSSLLLSGALMLVGSLAAFVNTSSRAGVMPTTCSRPAPAAQPRTTGCEACRGRKAGPWYPTRYDSRVITSATSSAVGFRLNSVASSASVLRMREMRSCRCTGSLRRRCWQS